MKSETAYIGICYENITNHDFAVSILYRGKLSSIELDKMLGVKDIKEALGAKYSFYLYKILLDAVDYVIECVDVQKGTRIVFLNFPQTFYAKKYSSNIEFVTYLDHHYLHACSTYYTSSFQDAAILVMDDFGVRVGANEESSFDMNSLWYGEGNTIQRLDASSFTDIENRLYSIGALYTLHTELMGIGEGSIMGLSSYGDPLKFKDISLYTYDGNHVYMNPDISYDVAGLRKVYDIPEDFDYENIYESMYADIAAKLQQDTQEAVVYLAKRLYDMTETSRICLAGGVALNILANTQILEQTGFKEFYTVPAVGDSGIALGGVYYLYHQHEGNSTRLEFNSPALGKEYTDRYTEKLLQEKYGEVLKYKRIDDIPGYVAKKISEKNTIAWFHGACEFGPRALGYRSIIADARIQENINIVNDIKNRERWRPLAPSILQEYISEYFSLEFQSRYMALGSEVISSVIDTVPCIVHIDGTSRYQSVDVKTNPLYNELITQFHHITGIPLVINTSLNVKGQPIIESPEDAIKFLLSTKIDALSIGSFFVEKKHNVLPEYCYNFQEKRNILFQNYKANITSYYTYAHIIKTTVLQEYSPEILYTNGEYVFTISIQSVSYIINFVLQDMNPDPQAFIDTDMLKVYISHEYGGNFHILEDDRKQLEYVIHKNESLIYKLLIKININKQGKL